MATVINLISSSPEPSRATEDAFCSRVTSHAPNPNARTDDFDLDDFDLPEWPEEHSAKKRKLSPTTITRTKSNQIDVTSGITGVVDLSSESDQACIQPVTNAKSSSNNNNNNNNTNFLSRALIDTEEEFDDILFTSSAPKLGKPQKSALSQRHDHSSPGLELSSDSLPDIMAQPLQQNNRGPSSTALESRSATIKYHGPRLPPEASSSVLHRTTFLTTQALLETITSSPPSPQQRNTKSKNSSGASDRPNKAKGSNRRAAATSATSVTASKKAEAQAQRAVEKAIKQKERESKAREKQLAAYKAEVNKSKIHKNDTTTDMIVEMCASLAGTAVGSLVQESMRELKVDTKIVEDPPSSPGNIIGQCRCPRKIVRWKRKVNSEYDHSQDEWVPLSQPRRQSEKHILVYMTAMEFISMLAGCTACGSRSSNDSSPDEATIHSHVDMFMTRFRSAHGDCIPILLIDGLDAWLRKKTNTRNREYTAAVRAGVAAAVDAEDNSNKENVEPGAASQAKQQKRKRKPASGSGSGSVPVPEPYLALITPDLISTITLHIQLSHSPLIIQHTRSPELAAVEITKFTQHLSTRPGRLAFQSFNLKSASFCMETGQVRTGDNPRDVYARMLQAVQRVTPSMAYGIVSEYETVGDLVKGFKAGDAATAATAGGGRLILQDVRKSMNRDGAWTDKKLGPTASKRLYKIFMGRDPTTRGGIA